jgi:aminopeptidase N
MKVRGPYLAVCEAVKAIGLALTLLAGPAVAQVVPGHRLPEGSAHPVRERLIDVQHIGAELRIDTEKEEVSGAVTITFVPLRDGLGEVALDAAGLDVAEVALVRADGTREPLTFRTEGRELKTAWPGRLEPGTAVIMRVAYRCKPRSGLYFQPAARGRSAQAWNYGEGGLHYGWLPLYNDTNDRFSVELSVTAAKPLVTLSNGVLEETVQNADGTRTFRWVQEEPIPNYLLALDVAELVRISLGEAKVGGRSVPVGVWGPPGSEASQAYAFRDTAKMVEFFSERFGVAYPWAKYDQVSLREFEGAMETATMVGFGESYAHLPGDPPDGHPDFERSYPTWTVQDTISHELAHHWFGDFVTCRSLGSLWLNESFATFSHTLWNGHAHGEDDLTNQRWRYLDTYLDYVRRTGSVRPMEYPRYEAPEAMYQEETTYIKGSLVLHMLRHFVGDGDFFRAVGGYLKKHAFGEVDSEDLKQSFQESTGRNLSWFFEDWVQGGGGHPAFEVSYSWSPARKQVDLSVRQVQADLSFENAFRLPVDVEVFTAAARKVHTVTLDGWSTRVALPADTRPLAVVFDKGNWIVGEIRFERPLEERVYLLEHGELAERLRAARQIVQEHPRRPETTTALARVIADKKAHWGIRQEAAQGLGAVGGVAAVSALVKAGVDPDPRLRRAAAFGLGAAGGPEAEATLRKLVQIDTAEDVVATAAYNLGRMRAAGSVEFLKAQLRRDSRWWEAIRTGALMGLAEREDPALAAVFATYVDPGFPRSLRVAALTGWHRAAPGDPALAARLRELTEDRNRNVRQAALEKLGTLHRAEDLPFLRALVMAEPDPSLAHTAREALEEIEAFLPKPREGDGP